MPATRIDRDEFEAIRAELQSRDERREGDVSIITGRHEDIGRVTLRRDENVFTVESDDTSFVRPRGVPVEEGE